MNILEKLKISEQELKAIKKGLETLNVNIDDETIIEHYIDDTITINKGRDNKQYVWIIWSEDDEIIVDIETLETNDNQRDIEKLFC